MAIQEYVFDDTRDQTELIRLRAIEGVFDPPTKIRLESTGLSKRWRCLEVGPGAGSIMFWLGEKVGPAGRVTAVDINPRFLDVRNSANIDVVKADIREVDFERNGFDLIHGRYVLLHIHNYQSVLEKLLKTLKPGGWLVLEEPDFSAARPVHGPKDICRSVEKVNLAIYQMYRKLGIDHAAGLKLPAALRALGMEKLRVDNDAPLACGGSGVAQMTRISAEQLRDKYIATNEVTAEDIDAYFEFAEDPNTWAIYYSTIAVTAQSSNRVAGGV
ncbi:MAG: class I SAM-dependent methyltransferase [Gammaproteobacteria bacterium]